jgi:hypothetical protein
MAKVARHRLLLTKRVVLLFVKPVLRELHACLESAALPVVSFSKNYCGIIRTTTRLDGQVL